MGRYVDAEPLLKRALTVTERSLGSKHPDLAHWLAYLALLYQHTDRGTEAEPLFRRAISIFEKRLPGGYPNLRTIRSNYADLLDQLGRTEEAAAVRARAAD